MSEYFLTKNQLNLAKLAAFWSVQKVLKVQLKVREVAMSFASVMKVLRITGEVKKYQWVQDAALIQVARAMFSSALDLDSLTAVAGLYKELVIWL